MPLVFGWPVFLFPVHIVFLEFVIDPACSIAFEAEPNEKGAMQRPPRAPGAPLFDARMLGASLAAGVTLLAAVFAVYWWALESGRGDGEVRALGFAAIVYGNVALIFVNRSRERLFHETLREPNPALWAIAAAALGALAVSIYWPPACAIFRFAPLAPADMTIAAAAGIAGVAWLELRKLTRKGDAA